MINAILIQWAEVDGEIVPFRSQVVELSDTEAELLFEKNKGSQTPKWIPIKDAKKYDLEMTIEEEPKKEPKGKVSKNDKPIEPIEVEGEDKVNQEEPNKPTFFKSKAEKDSK